MWEVLYQDALLEFDDAKLPKRILKARSAIRDREQEILSDAYEHQLLDKSLQTLETLEEIAVRKLSA
jgi:hypothetical protein